MSDAIILQNIREIAQKAKSAYNQWASCSKQQKTTVVEQMIETGRQNAEYLVRLEAGESGRGNFESKYTRLRFILDELEISTKNLSIHGIIDHCPERKFYKIAAPLGVIVVTIPGDCPSATVFFHAINGLLAGNSMIFVAAGKVTRTVKESIVYLQSTVAQLGVPEDCLQFAGSGCEVFRLLLEQREVNFIFAGADWRKIAGHSGKPAICSSESNTPVYIDHNADIEYAARCISASQQFDCGMSYGAEEFLLIHHSVYSYFMKEMARLKSFIIENNDEMKLVSLLEKENLAGMTAGGIGRKAGINIAADVPLLLVPQEKPKLSCYGRPRQSPILPVCRVRDWEEACYHTKEILEYGGKGHTVAVHGRDTDIFMEFVVQVPVSRILVNAPAAQAAMGWASGLLPSLMLATGTYGGSVTSDNITGNHYIQHKKLTTCVDSPIHELDLNDQIETEREPEEKRIWGGKRPAPPPLESKTYLSKVGKSKKIPPAVPSPSVSLKPVVWSHASPNPPSVTVSRDHLKKSRQK